MRTLMMFVTLGLVITAHEAGHWVAALLLRVRVLKATLGFGPKMFVIRRAMTEYSLAAVPLGATVRLLEDGNSHDSLSTRPGWQKLFVVFAGPVANILLSFLVLWVLHWAG